jgi:hypothetical protein
MLAHALSTLRSVSLFNLFCGSSDFPPASVPLLSRFWKYLSHSHFLPPPPNYIFRGGCRLRLRVEGRAASSRVLCQLAYPVAFDRAPPSPTLRRGLCPPSAFPQHGCQISVGKHLLAWLVGNSSSNIMSKADFLVQTPKSVATPNNN